MKVLDITNRVYEHYRTEVNDNENISRDQAARKLTRNIMLAKEIPPRNEQDVKKGNKMYYYGCLHIVTRNDRVIYLNNHRGSHCKGWKLDTERYIELTKQFGIK